jgi:RHS repeat-associated protein
MMSTALRTYYRGHNLATLCDDVAQQRRVYHFDHQGTTQCLTDSGGTVTDRFASDAWGVEVKKVGTMVNRQSYVGNSGYYLGSVGSCYVRQRHYAAHRATWLSVDPLDAPSSPHADRYSYAAMSPVGRIDPTGLDDSILDALQFILDPPCEVVCAIASGIRQLQGKAGGVVCWLGKACPCEIFSTEFPIIPGTCPKYTKCALVHEQGHLQDIDCSKVCIGRPDVKPGANNRMRECILRRDGLACMIEACKEDNAIPGCADQINDILKSQTDYLRDTCVRYYGAQFAPPDPPKGGKWCSKQPS